MNSSLKILRKNLIFTALSSVTLAFLHILGIKFDLYYLFSFYDLVLHFLGGLTLGLFFTTILGIKKWHIVLSFFIVILLSIFWEIFEVVYGIAVPPEDIYWLDTLIDMIMDTAGLLLAMYYVKKSYNVVK